MEEITYRFLSVITILSIIFWRSSVADPVPNQLATLEENVDVVDFDVTISGNISSYEDGLRRYKYELINASKVVRVWAESLDAEMDNPLLVVIRHPKSVVSWQIPLPLDNKYYYNAVARTLCPPNITELARHENDTSYDVPISIYVEFSTSSKEMVNFKVKASLMVDFLLSMDEHKFVNVSPSQPQYFGFVMPEGLESVVLNVRSNDKKCMVVSVQDTKCPVFDLDTNVMAIGTYQTMTTKSAISITRKNYQEFFVVFVVKPDDFSCDKTWSPISPAGSTSDKSRTKTVEVWIDKAVSHQEYYIAIGITLSIFLAIYLVAFALWGLFVYRDARDPKLLETKRQVLESLAHGETQPLNTNSSSESQESSPINRRAKKTPTYGSINERSTISSNISEATTLSTQDSDAGPSRPEQGARGATAVDELANAEDGLGGERQQSILSGNSDEYDTLPDAREDKSIIRIKPRLVVADLARKSYKKLHRKYSMYHWNLITIAIFYTLPVIQLVITYQTVVTVTGNEDLCYYNFQCARPLGAVFAFNTVFSNIGYVLFGILFLIMVKIRDIKHQHRMKENEILETKYGIPRHYGLFYAMGIALVMEGILSASYHICPNYTNFQFDTAFMYMIAALCMLEIYQIRHPDINAHSHIAYAVMAFVILIAVIGVVYNSVTIWVVFSIAFIILLFLMSAEFYYKSQWKIDRGVLQRLRQEWSSGQGWARLRPMYPDRMIYLILCNAMNLGFVIWGLIERPKAFAAFLIVVFISNLLLYLVFYVCMKLRHRERLKGRVVLLGLLAAATWGGSFAFFLQERISWMKTPALSRELNDGCILFGFYDTHDIWHFLSSLSLFLSFILTMIMDDDLKYTPQDKIAVF